MHKDNVREKWIKITHKYDIQKWFAKVTYEDNTEKYSS